MASGGCAVCVVNRVVLHCAAPCRALVKCPEGTSYPDGRPLAGLVFGFIIIGMYIVYWLAQFGMWSINQINRTGSGTDVAVDAKGEPPAQLKLLHPWARPASWGHGVPRMQYGILSSSQRVAGLHNSLKQQPL